MWGPSVVKLARFCLHNGGSCCCRKREVGGRHGRCANNDARFRKSESVMVSLPCAKRLQGKAGSCKEPPLRL